MRFVRWNGHHQAVGVHMSIDTASMVLALFAFAVIMIDRILSR